MKNIDNLAMSDFEKKYYESQQFWTGDVLLDEMNKKRMFFTASLIPDDTDTLLDVGCGNGIFLKHLTENASLKRIVGTDRSETALKMVNSEKVISEISALPFSDKEFDCSTCLEVLEHLPQETFQKALREISRVTSKYIIITVPFNEVLSAEQTECPKCNSKFNSSLHLRSFDEAYMKDLFNAFDFKCIKTEIFFPFKENVGSKKIEKLEKKLNGQKFEIPICPLCGYEEENFIPWSPKVMEAHIHNPSFYNKIKQSLKKIWPKKSIPGFWIAGIYKAKYLD